MNGTDLQEPALFAFHSWTVPVYCGLLFVALCLTAASLRTREHRVPVIPVVSLAGLYSVMAFLGWWLNQGQPNTIGRDLFNYLVVFTVVLLLVQVLYVRRHARLAA